MSAPESPWCFPREFLVLGYNEVHVWRATLDLPVPCVQSLGQTLAADERTRAKQFHFPKDRMHFIVARGILRAILGCYLAQDPRTLQFCYSEYGKPLLDWKPGRDALSFNVTHSGGIALFAITRNRDVGVDLEYARMDVAWEQIAERFFSPGEVDVLRTAPLGMQQEAFFCCWTRKEAYLKARGIGLSLALNGFDVSVTPGAPAELLSTREENQDIARWSLFDLFPGPGYIAALAVEGHPSHIKCLQWSDVNAGAWWRIVR
jgi:4'-phosphopantetheinyl transferase